MTLLTATSYVPSGASAATATLHEYRSEPSGIRRFGLVSEKTSARTPVHALPEQPAGRKPNFVASFLIAELTVQSGTPHLSLGSPEASMHSWSVVHDVVGSPTHTSLTATATFEVS